MRIYFAAPFTRKAKPHSDSAYGWVSQDYVEWLDSLVSELEKEGYEVHLPHRDDHLYGRVFPEIGELCKRQYEKITRETDVLLAYLDDSQGVAIEIGYAISHRIPVIIIKRPEERITSIAYGLNSVSPCEIVEFEDESELIEKLKEKLSKLKRAR